MRLLITLSILLLGLVFPLGSQAQYASYDTHSRPVSLTVVDRATGESLEQYFGAGTKWVAGEPGHPYTLRLQNHSNERVLAVVSVDGVNVISGKTASADQAGYVLLPFQTMDITGWRKSYSTVASFVFSSPRASYAARTGRPGDLGVLGVAVFRERERPPMRYPHPQAPRTMSKSSSEAVAQDRSPSLGTGHGDRETSWAQSTTFVRRTTSPAQVLAVRYETWDALVARGIIRIRPRSPYDEGPNPFPGDQFVPDPGW
jgi:hypothetical protein